MIPELFADVSRNLAAHEGRKLSMYLDTVGVVTCGVGHALFAVADAYRILWWKDANILATREEVQADWTDVKRKIRPRGALIMTYEESQRILQSEDLERFERVMRETFSEVDTYPHTVQVGLYDICFNCGSFAKWPRFSEAIHARNWSEAAKESHRPQVSAERNKDTFDQLAVV